MQSEADAITALPTLAEFIYAPIVNYALQQAHVPIVRQLVLKNNTKSDWYDVRIRISLTPDFAASFEHCMDLLSNGGVLELDAVKMPVKSSFLAELTERMEGDLHLKIIAGETLIFEEHYNVAILPYDYWQGISLLPEGIAAFITPNHPQIPSILRRASQILQGWTGSPSFDEYQSRNPDRVRKQMAAIYEAIAELQIIYCTVPASFEAYGQRVRLADAVLAQKMGNCLDLSLLYAACLEAVGIRPLLIVIHGHAFAGAWLIEESFADPVSDDPSLLSKRMASGINEIALVESTAMSAGKATHFDDAVRIAESHLVNIHEFVLFVDVKRTRFSRIRPLPLRIAANGTFQIVEEAPQEVRISEAPTELGQTITVIEGKPVTVGKQQLWERKLLDLTLRNNLLSLRITKGTLQFIHINPAKLEDALAGGDEFQILPRPADWDNPLRSAGLYQALHDADPMLELAAHELSQKRLRSYLSETELANNLTALYRASRTAIEENGASTLYIALGFLKWFETPVSEAPRYAPILLLPVELLRKSARVGYVIRSREEEPMLNITLLEKLRQDYGINIGGLDVLPRDESGVDVPQVFNIIRRAIMAKNRWDVEEQIILGTFSFNKFILWNDIHNNAHHLLRNKTVASLVSGRLEWEVVPEQPRELDEAFPPESLALPIATDSSQLEAIISSGEGKSFVLHGPPGTGKSQTITNIIANALFAGKKVLFVAAKKAALDVVQSRLESIGIGSFCMELHSNKAKKTAVIEQLKRVVAIHRKPAPEGFSREAERLAGMRAELNDYVKALHRLWPFGYSLYDAFSRWSAEEAGTPDNIPIPHAGMATLTAERMSSWNETVRELAIIGKAVGIPDVHPLRGIQRPDYSPTLKSEAAAVLQEYMVSLQNLEASLEAASEILCIKKANAVPEQTEALAAMATIVLNLPDIPAPMLADAPEQRLASLKSWTTAGRARDAKKETLLQLFSAGILNVDAPRLLGAWQEANGKWFLPKWLGQGSVLKALKPYAQRVLEKAAIPETLQSIIAYREAAQKVVGNTVAQSLAGFLYHEDQTDWQAIDTAAEAIIALNSAALKLAGSSGLKNWRQAFSANCGDSTAGYIMENKEALNLFVRQFSEAKQHRVALKALLHTDSEKVEGGSWIAFEISRITNWRTHIESLKDWCAWIAAWQKATSLGLESVAQALSSGAVLAAELEAAYRKSFYRSGAEYILSQSPQLAQFNSALFEEKIARFKLLCEHFEALTREELYARLAARIPDFSQEASQSSEVGILQRAIRSNGRATSIRRLFDQLPNLLPRLSPCMLMSPISVAQYFDATNPKFDLVIFDEASQMPTCDAVGAIARGNTLVVVGDPKQMPPTSFFAANQVDEENLEQEDLESILDDCLALSMPSRHLLWHYRSRHESLIAFSNAKYYDNSLLTFPSTDDLATKVNYVHVPGYYDKGKTRQNKAEANAIVAEILRRLQDPYLRTRSIGVVTFSVVQQNLIEDLLNEEFRKAPELEQVALESAEPMFIKNLENVQGDERDVILFSVCYGPDEQGRVSLNFGPLNREGGWRRLNVAVSRARYEMKIFGTLRADDIDLGRSSAVGVAGLKDFLSFAEKGKSALPVKAAARAAGRDGLTTVIAEAIRTKGYEVHVGIGCSGFRVDMGIVHPEKTSEYLLGILCDGSGYGAARTARDREAVQQSVLCALGWKLHRVWSTDWWEKKESVLAGIEAAVEAALSETKDAGHAAAVMETVPAEIPIPAPLNSMTVPLVSGALPVNASEMYAPCTLSPVANVTPELFLESRSSGLISKQIKEVIAAEAPVSKALLYRRVLAAWGISRAGSRVVAHLDAILEKMDSPQSVHGRRTFLWQNAQQLLDYNTFRLPANDTEKREAEDLPPEEVAACMKELLERQLSLPRAALIRECARLMGYARLGSKVEEVMGAGLELGVKNGIFEEKEDRIVLL